MLPKLKIALTSPRDEVLARVRETAEPGAGRRPIALATANVTASSSPMPACRTPTLTPASKRASFRRTSRCCRRPRSRPPAAIRSTRSVIVAKKGDSVASVLKKLGATQPTRSPRSRSSSAATASEDGIKPGQKLRVLLSPIPNSKRLQPVRVIVADDTAIDAAVALSDIGKYVQVDTRTSIPRSPTAAKTTSRCQRATGVTLYQSVYQTALRDQVPRPIIEDLIRIYSFDVDFQRKVQPGDSFEVLYAGESRKPGATDA